MPSKIECEVGRRVDGVIPENLTVEEKARLEEIRCIMALDLLGLCNEDIERVLGLGKGKVPGIRGNHRPLWVLAERDLNHRMRKQLTDVNHTIADLVTVGEVEMLAVLKHIVEGGKRSTRLPGFPSVKLTRLKGDVSIQNRVTAARTYLTSVEAIMNRVNQQASREEIEEAGLNDISDEFARSSTQAADKIGRSRVLVKARKGDAKRQAEYAERAKDTDDSVIIEN